MLGCGAAGCTAAGDNRTLAVSVGGKDDGSRFHGIIPYGEVTVSQVKHLSFERHNNARIVVSKGCGDAGASELASTNITSAIWVVSQFDCDPYDLVGVAQDRGAHAVVVLGSGSTANGGGPGQDV